MRKALPVLCVLTVAAGAVVMSARPNVPVGPSEPGARPVATGATPLPTADLPPLDCEEFAAAHVRELDAEMVRRAEAMMHGTAQLTEHAVSEECVDEVDRAKKRPRTGALAECARTAEKWLREPGTHVFGTRERVPGPGDQPSGPDARARIKECLPLAQGSAD